MVSSRPPPHSLGIEVLLPCPTYPWNLVELGPLGTSDFKEPPKLKPSPSIPFSTFFRAASLLESICLLRACLFQGVPVPTIHRQEEAELRSIFPNLPSLALLL